ncbi:hypothetical protein LCGC14_1308720 [marine sediment metagenome]|uniref:Uncharacterized protein n=1 Tax=marine sediment metagenome TaxID=412755 RepID=A0A0F9KMZ8_9ZZZZ
MDYKLVVTHYDGSEECIELEPENIVDIQAALNHAATHGIENPKTERFRSGKFGECLMDTKRRMDTVQVLPFDY